MIPSYSCGMFTFSYVLGLQKEIKIVFFLIERVEIKFMNMSTNGMNPLSCGWRLDKVREFM